MILEQHHAARLIIGATSGRGARRILDVRASVAEQGLHDLAAVVAGDVGVEILPDALDAVFIGQQGGK